MTVFGGSVQSSPSFLNFAGRQVEHRGAFWQGSMNRGPNQLSFFCQFFCCCTRWVVTKFRGYIQCRLTFAVFDGGKLLADGRRPASMSLNNLFICAGFMPDSKRMTGIDASPDWRPVNDNYPSAGL